MVGMWYLHLKSGKGVLYEEGEQSSSDSEVIVTDTTQFFDGNDTPFVISKGCILEVMHLFLLQSFLFFMYHFVCYKIIHVITILTAEINMLSMFYL